MTEHAVVMENALVRLEPLGGAHAEDLRAAVGDLGKTWYVDHVPAPEGVAAQIEFLLGSDNYVPWAVIDRAAGRAVGLTCMYNIDDHNRHCELGYTWLSTKAQGSGINAALKLLVLTRAFEELGFIRAEFRCHAMNWQSRRALEKLGATYEGTLRRQRIMNNGTVRDSCIYSILDYEWPTVKCGLEARVGR
ncbi:GNAT family N-acetyltransferase [Corynebacterium liangguodongii]|uniref:Amino acid acetyltransferase n=1 Tax=Corynebacterium liangguodongii TaxID=2079535 RepID=A0A2S0WDM4_9CORY|nr:GNAT family protein [Corynebacterium liangguodongii]AWB83861.1 amino acid acetyltransferase [Corynebacterium liangguodongii]PWB98981.1 N-acetyltransferase [Corynebacterium liangguodongii]